MIFTSIYIKFLKYAERFLRTDIVYLAHGSFWLGIGSTARMIIVLFVSILFARYLEKDLYGSYRYVLSIISVAGIFALPGLGRAMTRSVARGFDGTFRRSGTIIFLSSIIISLTLISASVYYYVNGNITLVGALAVAALVIPFAKGTGSWKGYLDAKKEFKKKTKYNIILRLFYASLMASTVAFIFIYNPEPYLSLMLMVGTYLISQAIPNIYFFLKTWINSKNKENEKGVISYGIHLSISNIPWTIATYIDGILLYHFLGPSALAVYSFAIIGPEQIKSLLANTSIVSFTKLSSLSRKVNNTDDLIKTLPKKVLKASLLTFAIVIAYILAAPLLYKILFPSYTESVIYSQIFALSLIFFPFSLYNSAIMAEASIKKVYLDRFFSPLIQIVAISILVPIYGLYGAIYGRIIGRQINYFFAYFLFRFKR